MAVNNNLYPPIVDTYMPAFLINSGDVVKDTCRVYFSLSSFNSPEDIKNVQITVRNQATNLSMLDPVNYPCEVMLTSLKEDTTRKTDDRYFVEIKKTDMINGNFEINQYYKVQFRFTGANATNVELTKPQQIDAWLTANLNLFSEWSTVCLVRGISSPTLHIDGFESDTDITYLADANVDVIGTLTFADVAETETLKNYRIQLLDADRKVLADSELQYSNNYNNINNFSYTLNYGLIEGDSYILVVEYTTQNLYYEKKEFEFLAIQTYADKLDADLKYVLDEANSAIGINIKAHEAVKPIVGNITIRRTSSESNFTVWEDVHTLSVTEDQELDYTWYDFTVESGIWYKYCAQKRSSTGQRGVIVQLNEPKMLYFEDMFLVGHNRQLKIEFNPTVSSFKRNVVESNTVTIGSKYPFIKRNGYTYYRSFPISGLISSEMDEDNIFTNREELLGKDNLELYDNYNKKNKIPYNYDFTYEREFREKVEEFLMENTVKLFRSPTEGNILVKLMDVNFQPNQTLGRRLYSFTATAYEIDENTIANYDKYGIQSLGAYEVHYEYPQTYFGQVQQPIAANEDVLKVIENKYQQRAGTDYTLHVDSLDYLRIEIEDAPYLIYDNGDGPVVAEPSTFATIAAAAAQPQFTYNGYLAYINHMPIVINPDGIYELTNEGVEVTSLYFPVPTNVNLDYNANISQIHNDNPSEEGGGPGEEGGDVRSLTFDTIVGQMFGGFSYHDPVIQRLWNKYYEIYSDYSQSLYYLNDVSIEAEPNTVIYVKEDKDFDYEKHIIGPTCLLAFQSEGANITGLYFTGIHFHDPTEAQDDRDNALEFIYKDTGITLDEHTLMRDYKLDRNGVYTLTPGFIEKHPEMITKAENLANRTVQSSKGAILNKTDSQFRSLMERKIAEAGNTYIWYNDRFWPFTSDHDLLCPVEATVNYTCDIIKERYV